MMSTGNIKSLIRKFVENKASEREMELLQQYFTTAEGLNSLDEIINEYADDFEKTHLTQSSRDEDDAIRGKEESTRLLPVTVKLWRAAAVLIGIVTLAGVYLYMSSVYSVTVYETVAGQKTTIILPDNSVVSLNGNSSLSYRGNWKDEAIRSVNLTGEAYFKVTSDAQKPFVVNASGVSIRVLGTTFNVKSYDDDDAVETTLVEGKVMIEKKTDSRDAPETVVLLPDQKAIFSKNSKQIVLKHVKPETEAAWVKGSLVFEDKPFSEIVKDLERWYGAKIIVETKSSLQCRFNTRIENESLEEVLELFSVSGNIKYSINNEKEVRIKGTLCQ